MEKDNFRDRPIESTMIAKVNMGDEVFICEKEAQKYASKLSDLTPGTVVALLTRHDHPRGIKVKIRTRDMQIKVGRVVYITRTLR